MLCRYNLKRKIAQLPPVTREWFDARKEKLASTTGTAVTKTWLDPLTRKTFSSENTYKAYVNSKKYKDLVKQSGNPAPEALVKLRRAEAPGVPPRPRCRVSLNIMLAPDLLSAGDAFMSAGCVQHLV